MSSSPVAALPAATVILVRAASTLEVLMVERVARGFFGGLFVFPGGGMEAEDSSDGARQVADVEVDDSARRCAAIRELAEETSILITSDGLETASFDTSAGFYQSIASRSLVLGLSRLTLISRWVTPTEAPKRYDTFFYLAQVEGDPSIELDTDELVSSRWVSPEAALERHESGEWPMFEPTVSHLRWLSQRADPADAVASAADPATRKLADPVVMGDGSIVPTVLPGADW